MRGLIINRVCRHHTYGLLRGLTFRDPIGLANILERCTCNAPPQSKHRKITHLKPDSVESYLQLSIHTTSHWPPTLLPLFYNTQKTSSAAPCSAHWPIWKSEKSSPRSQIPPRRTRGVYSPQPYLWRHSSRASALGQIKCTATNTYEWFLSNMHEATMILSGWIRE